ITFNVTGNPINEYYLYRTEDFLDWHLVSKIEHLSTDTTSIPIFKPYGKYFFYTFEDKSVIHEHEDGYQFYASKLVLYDPIKNIHRDILNDDLIFNRLNVWGDSVLFMNPLNSKNIYFN